MASLPNDSTASVAGLVMERFNNVVAGGHFCQDLDPTPLCPPGQSTSLAFQRPKRRQNRSCDQCRAGKRACDVQVELELEHGSFNGLESRSLQGLRFTSDEPPWLTHWPCSNCSKWRKSCTINWILSQRGTNKFHLSPKRRKQNGFPTPSPQQHITESNSPSWTDVGLSTHSNLREFTVDSSRDLQDYSPEVADVSQYPYAANGHTCLPLDNGTVDPVRVYRLDIVPRDHNRSAYPFKDDPGANNHNILPSPPLTFYSTEDDVGSNGHEHRSSGKRDRIVPLSPTLSYLLGKDNQRVMIKQNLLKVYHDSMEGALSCWLTERNCPYVHSSFNGKNVWSSDWTNRIVSRVCSLEKSNTASLLYPNRDERQATKVLNLTIMAFAAQWAQMGPRSTQRLPSNSNSDSQIGNLSDEYFDRSMQKSLWHQASQALVGAASNPSFKVVFALIIFSLTQRPHEAVTDEIQSTSLQHILDSDGPPIFLEMALRQLHKHRRVMKDAAQSKDVPKLEKSNKDTFDLLFWLAIMFDTLSAAMHQRSFVVTDSDSGVDKEETHSEPSIDTFHCDLDGWDGTNPLFRDDPESEVKLWGDYFLQSQSRSGDTRKASIRWPCSYEDAASALCDAAPVKVLLFRRVGQLQDLKCRPNRASAPNFEDAIDAALDVYNHWNNTYGLLIADCINHHEDLPVRIQSWYILLAGHWNLAVFILADVIDEIDQAGFTSPSCRSTRQLSRLATRLRSASALAVSELGRCSRYGSEDLSFSKSKDFHFAVNKAALLTEPWTVVLVRSFGRAGEILAGQLSNHRSTEVEQRLQYCVDALWLLGKKSDMALLAARVLARSMN